MRVLVTGDRGYIGAVLVPFLRDAGHRGRRVGHRAVRGVRLRGGPGSDRATRAAGHPRRDGGGPRGLRRRGLPGRAVQRPARPPRTRRRPTRSTWTARSTSRAPAKAAGVQRFVFASSCSLYGAAGSDAGRRGRRDVPGHAVRRDARCSPSRSCASSPTTTFSPTYLRNATAYGASPRLRARHRRQQPRPAIAMTSGEVRLQSDGTPWRPLVHVEDISRAFLAALEAPRELVHDEAFNVGRDEDNVQIREIAELVARGGARLDGDLRRRRRPGPARLPGRLRQAQRHLPGPASCSGPSRDGVDELVDGLQRVRPDARRLRRPRGSSGCAGSRSCSAPASSTTSCVGHRRPAAADAVGSA